MIDRASIRPRHIGRGNATSPQATAAPALAGFNSATAHRPWKLNQVLREILRHHDASIRPRHIGRGNLPCGLPLPLAAASIRPRHIGRGNPDPHDMPASGTHASIRPRHIGRGNAMLNLHLELKHIRFNSATAHRPWKRISRTSPRCQPRRLQFGHGTSAVETTLYTRAASPWIGLQFGHGTSAVETPECGGAQGRHQKASIRPRHIGRGNGTPGADETPLSRFNSATAHRPWKPARRAGHR